MVDRVTKPPLGAVPSLPPYGWMVNGEPIPAGGPHLFVLPTASLGELRAFWLLSATLDQSKPKPCVCSCHGRGFGEPPCGACWECKP